MTAATQYFLRCTCSFLLINCFVATYAQNVSAEQSRYALVIGISQYQSSAIPALNFAGKDAEIFAGYISANPSTSIRLLKNEAATIGAIYNGLEWLCAKAAAGDLVYIYFSGHGDVELDSSRISRGFLLGYDSPANNYINNALSVEDLNAYANRLSTINAAKVILVTDACHSGKLAGDFIKGKQLTGEQLRTVLNEEVRMTACGPDELAAEGPDWGAGRGAFSYYLINGLSGAADRTKDSVISLEEIQQYLDSSFANDAAIRSQGPQHPVLDGNPNFLIAEVLANARIDTASAQTSSQPRFPAAFRAVGRQPVDYFYELMQEPVSDTLLNYGTFQNVSPTDFALSFIDSIRLPIQKMLRELDSLQALEKESASENSQLTDSLHQLASFPDSTVRNRLATQLDSSSESLYQLRDKIGVLRTSIPDLNLDTLNLLRSQLGSLPAMRARLIERFVEAIHGKGQAMINAYLAGDLAELERRQYYYNGKRSYGQILDQYAVAIRLLPESHPLSRILKIQFEYIAALNLRLKMSTTDDTEPLRREAFRHLRAALALEPYAAYIHNEIGNLFMQNNQYDSAQHSFHLASILAPNWAIPWSNLVRLNLAEGRYDEANAAFRMADSLQPGLSYVNINAGLLFEKEGKLLQARSRYLQAIAANSVHYLPYQRLGHLYSGMGDYAIADSFYHEAALRKDQFRVNEKVFYFGIELGGENFENSVTELLDEAGSLTMPGAPEYLNVNSSKLRAQGQLLARSMLAGHPGALNSKVFDYIVLHEAGRYFDSLGQWQSAEYCYRQAMKSYRSENALRSIFQDSLLRTMGDKWRSPVAGIFEPAYFADHTTTALYLFNAVAKAGDCSYDEVDDLYPLARIYERQGRITEAVRIYDTLIEIEQNRQSLQAAMSHRDELETILREKLIFLIDAETSEASIVTYLDYIFGTPVPPTASFLKSRLLEKNGDLKGAEELLLSQVRENRFAGNLREKRRRSGRTSMYDSPFNTYWLKVNYLTECEVYNFYQRMLQRDPRGGYWYEKAGQFLYDRLLLSYSQMDFALRPLFYRSSLGFAYPFKGSEEPPVGMYEPGPEATVIPVPAVKDSLTILEQGYDPLQTAANLLRRSFDLSTATEMSLSMKERLADLYSWMGKYDSAILYYKALLKQNPNRGDYRRQLANNYRAKKDFASLRNELDTLFQQNQISYSQLLELSALSLETSDWQQVPSYLAAYAADLFADSIQIDWNRVRFNWRDAAALDAIPLLLKRVPTAAEQVDDETDQQQPLASRAAINYSIAYSYALAGKKRKAIDYLERAREQGFNYEYVILNDALWKPFARKKRWQRLMQMYPFPNIYEGQEDYQEQGYFETIPYRIPDYRPIQNDNY